VSDRWRWLESTRELQSKFFDVDYEEFAVDGDALADYLHVQTTAAHCEITEFLDEIDWKPWMHTPRGVHDRTAAIGELVDLGHFLANMLCALDVTDEEWEALYTAKQRRNRARRESGAYTKEGYKCPGCSRELDRPGAVLNATVDDAPVFICSTCATKVDISYRCSHCGVIEPTILAADGQSHCGNCGGEINITT